MLRDKDVLSVLQRDLSQEQLANELGRLLRVPETWALLHDPEILGAAARLPAGALTPARIMEIAAARSHPTAAAEEGHAGAGLGSGLEEALAAYAQAQALVEESGRPGGAERLTDQLLDSRAGSASAFALAWPQLQVQREVAWHLLERQDPEATRLLSHALLANQSIPESAAVLLASGAFRPAHRLHMRDLGEMDLLQALRSQEEKPAPKVTDCTLEDLLDQATGHVVSGDSEAAQGLLWSAWDMAATLQAKVADQLAEAASDQQDQVAELEARRNALRSDPTPRRRAELAAALTAAGQPREALELLGDELDSPEGRIAQACGHAALGNLSRARSLLASLEMETARAIDSAWLRRWQHGLRLLGDLEHAIRLGRLAVEQRPTGGAQRLRLAEDLLDAGCASEAAEQAQLAMTMLPELREGRRLLARALESAGDPAAALPHWKALSADEPDCRMRVGECALQMGDSLAALQSAEACLTTDPSAIPPMVLAARALRQQGEFERAGRYLDAAQTADPGNPEVIVTRAEILETAGQTDAAGPLLASGVQSNPRSAALRMAYARWLRTRGQESEALSEAERAVALEPSETGWKATYAEMLAALGHTSQAQSVLEDIVARVPGNLAARHHLVKIYRSQGRLEDARAMLQSLPADAPAELHLEAARLELVSDTPEAAGRALAHLERAVARRSTDPEIPYWYGVAHALRGEVEQAYQAFSSFLDRTDARQRELLERAWLGLSRAGAELDRSLDVLSRLDAARAEFEDSASYWLALSISRMKAASIDLATEAARHATTLAPEWTDAWRQLRVAASQTGDWDAAMEAAAQLTRLVPERISTWLEYAQTAVDGHATQIARLGLARALSIDRKDGSTLERCAELALRSGALDTSRRLLQRAHRIAPEDVGLLQRLARLSKESGDWLRAETAWTELGRLAGDQPAVLDEAAQGLWDLGRRGHALALWRQSLEKSPLEAEAHARLGRALVAQRDFEEGLKALREAYDLAAHDPQYSLDLGRGLMAASRHEEARQFLERAARLAPDRLDILLGLSECLLSVGAGNDARQLLEEAASLAQPSAKAWAMLALARMQSGEPMEAEAALRQAADVGASDEADVWLLRAARAMGDWGGMRTVLSAGLARASLSAEFAGEVVLAALELRNARWLFGEAAGARAHLPPSLADLGLDQTSPQHKLRDGLMWTHSSFNQEALQTFLAAALHDGPLTVSLLPWVNDTAFGTAVRETSAVALLEDRQPQEALHALAMPADAGSPGTWTALLCGVAHGQLGNWELARKALQFASRNPAVAAVAHSLMAWVWQQEARNDQAIACFNDALGIWPDEPEWHAALATCYLRQNDLDLALPHLQQAASLQAGQMEPALAYARALSAMNQNVEALEEYAQVIKLDPGNPTLLREAGILAVASGQPERAEAWLDKLFEATPDDAALAIAYARTALQTGRLDEAARRAERALDLAADDPDVLHGAGDIYAAQGKFEKAIQAYDQAVQRSQAPLPIRLARARLLTRIGRPAQAALELQAALERHPVEEGAWEALSQAQEELGDLESALKSAAEAVRLAPRRSAYRLLLGRLCLKAGQLDRALDELSHAQSRAPEDAAVAVELGKVYEARREFQNALESFQRAIRRDPENAAAHYHAGVVLRSLKAYSQAGRMFQRAVDLTPRDLEALHQLAAVRALELVHGNIPLQAVLQ